MAALVLAAAGAAGCGAARGMSAVASAAPVLPAGEAASEARGAGQERRGRDEPPRLVGAGVSVRFSNPVGDALAEELAVGPILRLGAGDGFGPAMAFNWTSAEIAVSPTGAPALATMRIRPVMAGLQYSLTRGRLSTGASVVGGVAFNSLDIDRTRAGPGRAVAARNSFVWRPGVTLWYEVTPRIGLNVFGGYLVTRPEVTFVSDTAVVTHRLRANSVVVSMGLAYWIF